MFLRTLSSSLALLTVVQGLSPSGWRAQSIYQVMTDRFARTDGSTTASCDLSDYCGGTWQGLINHLDYIQNMGSTAVSMRISLPQRVLIVEQVWISPVVKNLIYMQSTPTLALLQIWYPCQMPCTRGEW
jgi:alpha-amylase